MFGIKENNMETFGRKLFDYDKRICKTIGLAA
jgi:hypothetical protein